MVLALAAFWISIPVNAQIEARALVSGLNLSEFPKVKTFIDVRGPQGYFVSGLPSNAATIYEDEQPIPALITEVRPGGQLVFAYGGGENFGIINLDVLTRFQVLSNWMANWAATQAENGLDDLSLIAPEGVLFNHQADPTAWAESLQAYQPDFNRPGGTLETLSAAIDMALDPLREEGMGRAVLFLTQSIPEDQQAALQSLIDKATQAGVRVNIGFIAATSLFESNDAIRLQAAALQTGGQYFAFSSDEPLPDLNILFESSRRAYALEYRSSINTPGSHTLSVGVLTDLGEIKSDTLSFETQLAPPIPVFVAPPLQIVRSIPEKTANSPENLVPTLQTFEILVEFPDTIQRQIVKTVLYVNGVLAAENTSAPLEQINLDLTPYETSQTLTLRVEVTDELGLSGGSVDTPVEIVVQAANKTFFSSLGQNTSYIILGLVGLSGAILFLVLVMAGRIRPKGLRERRRKRAARQDPVTQPVPVRTKEPAPQPKLLERLSRRISTPRISWPARTRPVTDPYAYIVRINEAGEPLTESQSPVTVSELTFGSDVRQAVVVLDDPAVEPLHARLWRDDEGGFHLEDNGTIAGTWINYAPVPAGGGQVLHGDLIHIGKIGFRFTLSRPTEPRRPVVSELVNGETPSAKESE